jgi:RND family efflux transporter MFP subunit
MTSTPHPVLVPVVLCAALTMLPGCRSTPPEEVDSEAAVSVKARPATLGHIRGMVRATGIVNPAPGADLVVTAPEPARIAAIGFAVGDRVRRGDVLVRFEIPAAAADVQRQQAEVTRAEVSLANAKLTEKRATELVERGVAARKDIEEATRALADAEAAVEQARASLAASRTLAARSTVRATFDGLVAARLHNPGDFVAAAGDTVVRVIDPGRFEVLAAVPLSDAPRVRIGAAARVPADQAAPEIGLRVISRPAAVETGTATVPVRLALSGPANIPAGSPVLVDIDAEEHENVVVIPAPAIVREGEDVAVFVVNAGKAQRRRVQTGLTDGTAVEIVSGLKVGEIVIIDGQAGLPDGAPVAVEKDASQDKTPPASGGGEGGR